MDQQETLSVTIRGQFNVWAVGRMAALGLVLAAVGGLTPLRTGAEAQPDPPLSELREPQSDTLPDTLPDQIVVRFRDGAPALAIGLLGHATGATALSTQTRSGLRRFALPPSANLERVIAAFRSSPLVAEAGPSHVAALFEAPDDTNYSYQWHLHDTNGGMWAESAWSLSATPGQGATVAVLDTGVAYEAFTGPGGLSTQTFQQAPDLVATTFVAPWDFYNNDAHANDDHGHGTHVTGTIAQDTGNAYGVAGIAYASSIMPVKVLAFDGTGFDDDLVEAIYYAVDNGADVINMSLGFSGTGAPDGNGDYCTEIVGLGAALDYAHDNGVVVVAAAGNEGAPMVSCPAAYPTVIAVGATRFDAQVAGYSNTGGALDVTAPGGDLNVDQNNDGYADGVLQETYCNDWLTMLFSGTYDAFCDIFMSGTSMASPHVAGLAALLLGEDPTLTPDDVRTLIESTARDGGAAGWDASYGWGIVDASAALNAMTLDTTPPVAAITAPADGDTISGTVSLDADATDASGIHKVRFWADTAYLGFDWIAPYSKSWDSRAVANGVHSLTIEALDWEGNSTFDTISVTVANSADTVPPTASITAPGDGDTVSGAVTFDADASDASGIQKIRFWVDNAYLGFDSTAPYGKSWDTTAVANGTHTLKIEALDLAGNSTVVVNSVTVANLDTTPPLAGITSPADGSTVSSTVSFEAAASDASGIHKVRFWVDGTYLGFDWIAPYSKSWDSRSVANGAHTLTIQAIDWEGNSTFASISVTVANVVDTVPPLAAIIAPADGDTVSGTIAFNADASDASGIHKVRFWVDSTYLGFDWIAPYGKSWDSTTVANGAHTLKIEALDWAGNSTFVVISATVEN